MSRMTGQSWKEFFQCEISDIEAMHFPKGVPLAVSVRIRLNQAGFKFKDDGMFTAVINEAPEPLGTLSVDRCIERGVTRYRQVIHGGEA